MPEKFQLPTLAPINFSLTAGTSIPAPPESPNPAVRPPTPGGGPLSSHPTTPLEKPGTPSNGILGAAAPPLSPRTTPTTTGKRRPSNPLKPVSPTTTTTTTASGYQHQPSPHSNKKKRPSSVRKFLGLRSLNIGNHAHMRSTDSLQSSATAPNAVTNGTDAWPPSPQQQSHTLRRKSSAGWFGRRASGFFGVPTALDETAGEGPSSGAEAATKENEAVRSPSPESPPRKPGPPPPTLPDLKAFGVEENVGSLGGGDMFKNIR